MPCSDLLSAQEAADRLRVSRGMVYKLSREKQLTTVRVGRRRMVTVESLARYIEQNTEKPRYVNLRFV